VGRVLFCFLSSKKPVRAGRGDRDLDSSTDVARALEKLKDKGETERTKTSSPFVVVGGGAHVAVAGSGVTGFFGACFCWYF